VFISKRRRREDSDDGFTLVEVLIAMGLAAIILVATAPALLGMLGSTLTVKLDSQAKNLAQERLEELRDLRFHVDRQNGPYLDLLDIYYTNATSASPVKSLTVGGTSLTGQYVTSGATTPGEPAFPFYRTTTGAISGFPGFTQVVDVQFLAPDGTAIPASRFQDSYDSQVVGHDQPPSLLVGVTTLTKWTSRAKPKVLKTYTRVTDTGAATPLIQTVARAVAIDVTSTAADGTTLELQEGIANANGAQSSGSTAAGYAGGALVTRTGAATLSGLQAQFSLPTQAAATSGSSSAQAGTGCSWFGFGRTGVTDVTGDVSSGLPKAPADVDAASPANMLSGQVFDNSGGSCGLLSYDNLAGGGIARSDALGAAMGSAPFVNAADGTGGTAAISGSAYLTSNALTTAPQKSTAGATAFAKRAVVLFPNAPNTGGHGLVSVTLNSASVTCASSTSGGTTSAAYSVTVNWWGQGSADSAAKWHTATWTYDSTTGSSPVLTSGSDTWNPSQTSLGNGLKLSDLLVSSFATAPAVLTTGTQTGLRGFADGIVSFASASTLSNESGTGFSALKLQVGQLTCAADDQR
jgi:prepilin-type N-terminal cleavage/methylation domain-containing protein